MKEFLTIHFIQVLTNKIMSRLIENIKRLAGMVKNETKSGGNTAVRIGGLFEEIAAELEEKYDKTESNQQATEHNTDAGAHKNIQERIDTVLNDLKRDKLDKTGDGSDVCVVFDEAVERGNVSSGDTLSGLWGKVRKWFAGLQAVAFSGRTADLIDDTDHRLTTDTEKARWNDTYTRKETDDKDAEALRIAKEYAGSQVSNLGNDVYRKEETYNRGEINTLDAGILALAKEYARQLRNDLVNGAGEAMDTLFELSNALNNDPNFATTIMALIAGKADSWHTHTKDQITNFPTSLPASDVSAWAKQPNKPSYTPSEIGAATANHNHAGVYQPAGNYAPSNHNHDSAYQPKGSYATANHGHNASAITEETNKRFMTDAERSKLAGIETGANKYVHPNNSTTRHVTDAEKEKWNSAASLAFMPGTNGYAKIGTFMIVWGKALNVPGNSNTKVSFASAFTTCYNVHITMETTSVNNSEEIGVNNVTNTGFTICNGEGQKCNIFFVAFGYKV